MASVWWSHQMKSLKLLGPAEVNLCRTRLHSPSCLCRADELRGAASAPVLCMIRGETTLPLWLQMKNLLLVFSAFCCCIIVNRTLSYSPKDRLLRERWHVSCSWTLLYSDCCVWTNVGSVRGQNDDRERKWWNASIPPEFSRGILCISTNNCYENCTVI